MMKCIYEQPNLLGESPLWDAREDVLYWIDIERQSLHCLNADFSTHQAWSLPDTPGSIALHKSGGLLIALSQQIVHFTPQTNLLISIEGIGIKGNVRFNDGRCDALGRFWVGTLDLEEKKPIGGLYCLERDQVFKLMEKDYVVSNGLGWSLDNRTLYSTDSFRREIYQYDYNLEKGLMTNKRLFAKVASDAGYPDGLYVDRKGFVWSAHFMGGRITRYAPDGSVDRVISAPIECPTSCCIGGIDQRHLFVTSATRDLSEAQLKSNPLNGGVFMMDLEEVLSGPDFFYQK
jgi:sugar lactone lactonase YvrE